MGVLARVGTAGVCACGAALAAGYLARTGLDSGQCWRGSLGNLRYLDSRIV